jgi:hypothetical protein
LGATADDGEVREKAPHVKVEASPTRCPFCHEACDPDEPAVAVCRRCLSRHHAGCWKECGGRCASCGVDRALLGTEGAVAPAVKVTAARGEPERCPVCARPATAGKKVCGGCGTRLAVFSGDARERYASTRKVWVATLLCVLGLLGVAGLHRFYVGKRTSGLVMLLTLGGLFVWTLLDLHRIRDGDFRDDDGFPLQELGEG